MAQVLRTTCLILAVSLLGCSATRQAVRGAELTELESLELAAVIANAECMDRFDEAPFEASSYTIEFRDGRWFWGSLDAHGIDGFSALVSFDARGDDREVTVAFSYDTPLQVPPANDRKEQ